jgi:Uncharacterized conserved protein
VDLLGVLAYAHLVAFDTMAADARLAPDLSRRAVLSEMAAAEIGHYGRLVARLRELDVDPEAVMRPYVEPLRAYHQQTQPRDWLEGLVKAYVGEGIADDFYREVAGFLASPDRELVLEVLHDTRYADFAEAEIRAAIEADRRWPTGWRCGAGGWSARRCPRRSGWPRSGTRWPCWWWRAPATWPGWRRLIKRLTTAHTERMKTAGLNT